MMMLTEQTAIPVGALPVQAMKDHLRLGTGFADDGMQDGLIAAHLRAALTVIEGRTGKALLARRFMLRLPHWRDTRGAHALPMAPVSTVVSVTILSEQGVPTVIASDRYRLEPDMARPRLVGVGRILPVIPQGGSVEVVFDAGFGSDWTSVPADLAHAVMLLASEFYEQRHYGGQDASALPMAVLALIERWRTVRVLGGGSA